MARHLEFDEKDALTAAMHAFRRRGYAGVSIKMLEAETGLSSGSIYNSFGGKDAIFERALAHYNETIVDKRIRMHLVDRDPVAGLTSLFQSLLHEPGDAAHGCLLTNCSIEFAGRDSLAGAAVSAGFDRFLGAFKAALMSAPDADEVWAELASLRLLTYYQGLLVLIRHGHDKVALQRTIGPEILAIVAGGPARVGPAGGGAQ